MEAYKNYALKDLEKIHLAKQDIAKMSNSLIKDIGSMHKKAFETLKHFEEIIRQNLKSGLANESELILQMPKTEDLSKNIGMVEVQVSFEKNEKSKNYLGKTDGMNLREKIDYFQPIINWSPDYCYQYIKEIFVSNDGKYFFVCKFYVDNEEGTN